MTKKEISDEELEKVSGGFTPILKEEVVCDEVDKNDEMIGSEVILSRPSMRYQFLSISSKYFVSKRFNKNKKNKGIKAINKRIF